MDAAAAEARAGGWTSSSRPLTSSSSSSSSRTKTTPVNTRVSGDFIATAKRITPLKSFQINQAGVSLDDDGGAIGWNSSFECDQAMLTPPNDSSLGSAGPKNSSPVHSAAAAPAAVGGGAAGRVAPASVAAAAAPEPSPLMDALLAILPEVVASWHVGLSTLQPYLVGGILLQLQKLLLCHPAVGPVMLPHYAALLPTMARFYGSRGKMTLPAPGCVPPAGAFAGRLGGRGGGGEEGGGEGGAVAAGSFGG